MTLLLSTPEQHDFQDPTLVLDEKKVHDWLGSLPVLSAGESLRQVINALEPLNEQRMDADKRLRLLDIYRDTFKRFYVAAEPLRLRQQPLSRQQRTETAADVERLCVAMANGFKLVLKALYARGEKVDRPTYARVLRATMQALSAALLHSYRYYLPQPESIFLELNQVYGLARRHGLHDTVGTGDAESAHISLAGTYQTISLLSLCDPFSLGEGMADTCYRALERYAAGVRAVAGDSWQDVPEGLFFVDLAGDDRPRHCVSLDPPVGGGDPLILDARTALQQMHKTMLDLPADRRRLCPEAVLLRNLLPEVTGRDKRQGGRRRDGRWIGVVSGLGDIAAWLSARQRGEAREAFEWQVKDASDGGYCLGYDGGTASPLRVGELLCGVSESDDGAAGRLQLMVVRWLRQGSQGAELGAELIAGTPSPVQLGITETESPGRLMSALFIPQGGARGAARLIAPAQVYAQNRALLIYTGEREVDIRCGALVERTPGFDCFEFTST